MKKLNILGLVLSFAGTFALAIGLFLSNAQVAQLSGTYFDVNPYMTSYLLANRDWAIIGMVLITIGFILQLVTILKEK